MVAIIKSLAAWPNGSDHPRSRHDTRVRSPGEAKDSLWATPRRSDGHLLCQLTVLFARGSRAEVVLEDFRVSSAAYERFFIDLPCALEA